MDDRRRRRLLVAGLFLLAPFVGEFVLGNQPITALPLLVLLAPMYGGGALLVRETTRRLGAGWPTIVALAAAYALVEEGLVDQMLMNPAYLDLADFSGRAPIPGLGISAQLTAASLTLHTVWSIGVPIAIIEAFDPAEPRPWLGRVGTGAVAAVFVGGCTALGVLQYDEFRFLATPTQLAVTAAAIVGLAVLGLTVLRRRGTVAPTGAPAPRPVRVGAAAFGLTGLYWVVDVAVPAVAGAWTALGCWAALAVVAAVLLRRGAARPGWGRRHRLAVAGGALLTYLWVAPLNAVAVGVPPVLAAVGAAVFGAAAAAILALAVRAERRRAADAREPDAREPAAPAPDAGR
ncbi:MAG TPA: hypothetical protein VF667_03635 [Pseudonocardia sp.]